MDGNATCSLKFCKSEAYTRYCFHECGYCVPHLLLISCELDPGYPQPRAKGLSCSLCLALGGRGWSPGAVVT